MSNVLIPNNFKGENARKVVLTTRCTEMRGVPCLKVYLKVRVTVMRFTHRMLKCRSTGDVRLGPRAGRPMVTLVPSRRSVRSVNKALELKDCPYVLTRNSESCRLFNGGRVRRHRERHCRMGGTFHGRLRRGKVGVMKASPSGRVMRVVRVTKRPFCMKARTRPRFGSHPGRTRPLFEKFVRTTMSFGDGWLLLGTSNKLRGYTRMGIVRDVAHDSRRMH